MRSKEAHATVLPWASLEVFHREEVAPSFEWTAEKKEAFLLLLAKGYSVRQITSQGEGWPTYYSFQQEAGRDEVFHRAVENLGQKRASSLVDRALDCAASSRAATVQSDRLLVDVAFRTAAALDPERFGTKSQVGISGGLILAAGSLADLAAQAALMHTSKAISGTSSAPDALPSPDNVGQKDVI